jgi:hypothetical protein
VTVARLRDRKAAVAFTWAALAVPAAVAAIPAGSYAGAVLGHAEAGDAALFASGSEALLETARASVAPLAAATVSAPWLLLAAALFGLLPWAMLLASLSSTGPVSTASALERAVPRLPSLTLVLGGGLAVRALLLAGGSGLVSWMSTFSPNARTSATWALVAVVLTAAVLGGVRLACDVAEAAIVRHASTAARGTLTALTAIHRDLGPLALRFTTLAAARVALVAAAAYVTGLIGVATSSRVVAVLVLHQLTLAALCALRAAWLRVALESVGSDDPARALERALDR